MVSNFFILDYHKLLVTIIIKGGGSWTKTSVPTAYWASITSSSDGTYLAAAQLVDYSFGPGYIYTSSNG